jgi:hypothetical protein
LLYYGAKSFVFQFGIQKLKIEIYRTIILPGVVYWCETWSLAFREEHRLMVFENMVLMRLFEPKRDEETGEWKKLLNEDLNVCTHHPLLFG